jgi:hypothetical protein
MVVIPILPPMWGPTIRDDYRSSPAYSKIGIWFIHCNPWYPHGSHCIQRTADRDLLPWLRRFSWSRSAGYVPQSFSFSGLPNLVLTCHFHEDWLVDDKLASIWQILVPLVPSHPFVAIANSLDPSHSVFTSDSYKAWKAVRKPQILYIQGRDHEDSKKQAQQVSLSWQANL